MSSKTNLADTKHRSVNSDLNNPQTAHDDQIIHTRSRKKVAVIGLGAVGLSLASFLGSKNISVTAIDYDEKKIKMIQKGCTPFYEPSLKYYLQKSLKNGLNLETRITENTLSNDFIFITTGTPLNKQNQLNLEYVKAVALSLAEQMSHLKTKPSIVIKSTVLPGTAMQVVKPILEQNSLVESVNFDLLSNPEFLREGSAMQDTVSPHVIVIGGSNSKSIKKLTMFYKMIYPDKMQFIETNNATAEMIKFANNAFLATKISFINSLANICQKVGVNVDDVARVIGMDPRIGNLFLKAGPGYGGACLPKDVEALISFSNEIGYDPILLNAVRDTNIFQLNKIIDIIKQEIHSLEEKNIGILGLAFKEDTDDIRESVSIKLIEYLLDQNCKIIAHDPKAIENTYKVFEDKIMYCKDTNDVFYGTDCVILLTPWKEYTKINEKKILKMRNPLVIDTRRMLKISNKKIRYIGLGIGK